MTGGAEEGIFVQQLERELNISTYTRDELFLERCEIIVNIRSKKIQTGKKLKICTFSLTKTQTFEFYFFIQKMAGGNYSDRHSTYLFHIVILPILIYAGWVAYKGECQTHTGLYLFVVGLAFIGFLYHFFKWGFSSGRGIPSSELVSCSK